MEALRLPKSNNAPTSDEKNMRHFKGCNCRRSGCLKKYCECFQNGVKCTDLCKCEGCKNCVEKPQNTSHNKITIPIDLNKMCAEVTINKLLEPLSPEAIQIPTADNSIMNSNGDQGTNQSSKQLKQFK